MLAIYRFDDKTGQLNQQSRISPGVWINVVDPTPAERQQLQDKAKLSEAFLLVLALIPMKAPVTNTTKIMIAICLFSTCPSSHGTHVKRWCTKRLR